MGRKKPKRVDPIRWPGVYQYSINKHGKADISYYIVFRDGPKKIWEKVGQKSEGMTPQVADEIRHERTLKARHGETPLTAKQIKKMKAVTNRTVDQVAKIYLEQRKAATWGSYDVNRYDKHLKPVLGNRAISNLSPLDMERIKSKMKKYAPATVWAVLELIRRISNFGKKNGLTPGLSFKIDMPKRDNEIVQFLTPEEARRLLRVLDQWPSQDVANMLRLAMFSGMRRGEIFKLRDSDLDFINELITLDNPKGGKTVSIPMNPVAKDILENQIKWRSQLENEVRKNSPYLFPNPKGNRRTDSNAVDRIKKKAELSKDFRIFHGLRHHFAVTLANSGEFDLNMIGELLTHKSAEMTRRYAQYLPDSMKKAGNRAAELLQQHMTIEDSKAMADEK